MSIFSRFLSDSSQKVAGRYKKLIEEISSFESELKKMSDAELKDQTEKFKKRITENGEQKTDETLEEILPEAFATIRETSKRIWGERHFDVQLIGGAVLHRGEIAEMKTGEGKTLVATLPLYLNALAGRGVHLVTVNDFLSKSQGEGMGEIYNFLGLSVGVIQNQQISYTFEKKKDYKHYSEVDGSNLVPCSRKEAYDCDITYGTNNEFGFDYLRDNMAPAVESCVQRELNYAIVDEVDSILIDEARTPLIISAPAEESASLYQKFAAVVPRLKKDDDFAVDEKDRVVMLTDAGIQKVEGFLGIQNVYSPENITLVHHLEEALKAEVLFKKDKDYIVKDGEIIIVDEFTGRLMPGRRYSEGLHQAIEAKENVEVKRESQTMATISFQNLFRLYKKLSGMTGTAATEAEEFYKIYKLDVSEIPTNQPMIRRNHPDKIFKNHGGKMSAIIVEIKARQEKGQPVLVGTVSVEKNEELSRLLKRAGVKHEILNAKNHAREAKIIAKAGQMGAVTVATNMAGRGTDIKLGTGVAELGGLLVIGSERHEARRIDNQLRGRSGRQGDPGESQFYVSMQDDLMRIFGGERMIGLMERLGLPDDTPIENRMISRSIESAQKKVEGHNFDIRKHLVEYDDVMNSHRKFVYGKRRKILEGNDPTSLAEGELRGASGEIQNKSIKEDILEIAGREVVRIFAAFSAEPEKIRAEIEAIFGSSPDDLDEIKTKEFVAELYENREKKFGSDLMWQIERAVYLQTIDLFWVEHLTTMEELRTGIGLQGYAQTDPLVAYKREAYRLFQDLLLAIESQVVRTIFHTEVSRPQHVAVEKNLEFQAPDPDRVGDKEYQRSKIKDQNDNSKIKKDEIANSAGVTTMIRQKGRSVYDRMENSGNGENQPIHVGKKVGRNDPCSCGATGPDGKPKKYKKCCGK
ncbi:MAG: preprotein translocase subunit SecA [Candidatus Berkelbacteria bacterium]|nr:preprotein translocase subunit SecA [Candidatus Berkelbacteria bacterium]